MGKTFANFDWLIFLPILILVGFSLALLSSPFESFFSSQFIFFILGIFLFFVFARINAAVYKSLAPLAYIFSILLLLLTFLGPHIRGAHRWLEVFGLKWQPSELVKPLLILSFANFFSIFPPRNLKNIFLGFLLILPALILIFRQPDLGTAIITFGLWLGIVYAANLPAVFGLLGLVTVVFFLPLGWFLLKDYQKLRLLNFLNPFLDPAGAGYHSIQAIIAIGSGQIFGQGLGRGSQSHLLFLPEYHTDFIFASLVEELGLIGGLAAITAYAILLWRVLAISRQAKDSFAQLVCLGVFSQIFLQVFINIGMNLGFLPITGITLPLLSYGGSSLISTLITLGIVMSLKNLRPGPKAVDILP